MESHRTRSRTQFFAALWLLRQGLSWLAASSGRNGQEMSQTKVSYKPSDEVDFLIVGSGAAGGVLAKELSTNGFRVVVLEQGPYLTEADFTHDELKVFQENLLTNHPELQPSTFRTTADEKSTAQRVVAYGRRV